MEQNHNPIQIQLEFPANGIPYRPVHSPIYRHLPQQPYQLKRFPLAQCSAAKSITGTYFLFDGLYLVYIGYSSNIQNRLHWHKWQGIRFDSFAFIKDATGWKQAFVKCYRPRYNSLVRK